MREVFLSIHAILAVRVSQADLQLLPLVRQLVVATQAVVLAIAKVGEAEAVSEAHAGEVTVAEAEVWVLEEVAFRQKQMANLSLQTRSQHQPKTHPRRNHQLTMGILN